MIEQNEDDAYFPKDDLWHPDSLSPEEFNRIEDLFRKYRFRVDSADVVREGNQLKALLSVSWAIETSSVNSEHRTFRKQSCTVAYFDRPGIPTPAFTLQTKSGVQGFLQGMFAGISGLGIDFPDLPEFGKKYSVFTVFPTSTRALLNEKLRKSFLERVGVTVQTATDGRIAIYQSDSFATQVEPQEFLKVAEELAEDIFDSARLLNAVDRPNGKEVIEAYRSMGMLGPSVITSEDVNQLLSQPCPRKIPKKLLARAYGVGSTDGSTNLFFGLVFFSMGSIFAFITFLKSNLLWFIFPSVVALIGLSMLYFAMRTRKVRKRLLRDGTCRSLKVEEVQAHNTYDILNQRVFYIAVNGGSGTILMQTNRGAANMARRRKSRRKPIKVLVDPADPSKMLWLEEWAIDTLIDDEIDN